MNTSWLTTGEGINIITENSKWLTPRRGKNASKLCFGVNMKKTSMCFTQMHLVFQSIQRFWRKFSKMEPIWVCGPALDPSLWDSHEMNKLERGPWVLTSCQVSLKSLQRSLQTDNGRTDDRHQVITKATLSLQLGSLKVVLCTTSTKISI